MQKRTLSNQLGFADDKRNVTKFRFVSRRVENIFSLSNSVSKGVLFSVVKSHGCVVKNEADMKVNLTSNGKDFTDN